MDQKHGEIQEVTWRHTIDDNVVVLSNSHSYQFLDYLNNFDLGLWYGILNLSEKLDDRKSLLMPNSAMSSPSIIVCNAY